MSKLHGVPRIPIHALFGTGFNANPDIDPRGIIDRADVIFGIDLMTGNEFLVYGRDLLKKIDDREAAPTIAVVAVELDQDTNEALILLALCVIVKGRHDYRTD
jgi:hypothetical protein